MRTFYGNFADLMKGHRKPGPVLMPVRVYLFVGDSKKKVELPPSQGGTEGYWFILDSLVAFLLKKA